MVFLPFGTLTRESWFKGLSYGSPTNTSQRTERQQGTRALGLELVVEKELKKSQSIPLLELLFGHVRGVQRVICLGGNTESIGLCFSLESRKGSLRKEHSGCIADRLVGLDWAYVVSHLFWNSLLVSGLNLNLAKPNQQFGRVLCKLNLVLGNV